MVPLVLVFFVFYFLMIKPQKKKMQQEQQFLQTLQKGDEVYTKSGILGTITGITEKIITLEVAEGSKLKILKTQIGGSAKSILEAKA
jgi:preprotein translocase subunit YajC